MHSSVETNLAEIVSRSLFPKFEKLTSGRKFVCESVRALLCRYGRLRNSSLSDDSSGLCYLLAATKYPPSPLYSDNLLLLLVLLLPTTARSILHASRRTYVHFDMVWPQDKQWDGRTDVCTCNERQKGRKEMSKPEEMSQPLSQSCEKVLSTNYY